MKSPFPGMDPYLEGTLWFDVHQELASVIRVSLVSKIAPKYVARLTPYTVRDTAFKEDIGIMYPDIGVLEAQKMQNYSTQKVMVENVEAPTIEFVEIQEIELEIPSIEIRDAASQKLITVIEILSPANKRGEAMEQYSRKIAQLHKSGVHVLEIDLIRRGSRYPKNIRVPEKSYRFTLRKGNTRVVKVWTNSMLEPLPILPVPLQEPDEDTTLNLREALKECYKRGMYQYSINYRQDPPTPALTAEEQTWWQKHRPSDK